MEALFRDAKMRFDSFSSTPGAINIKATENGGGSLCYKPGTTSLVMTEEMEGVL